MKNYLHQIYSQALCLKNFFQTPLLDYTQKKTALTSGVKRGGMPRPHYTRAPWGTRSPTQASVVEGLEAPLARGAGAFAMQD